MNAMGPSRKRRSLTEIQLRIAEFKSSEPSRTEFAARLGVHPLSTDRRLRITHPTQSPQPTQSIASQNSPAFVPALCMPSASASSADGLENVAPSDWALRLPPGLDPSALRSILDLLPRGCAFSPTFGSISWPVRRIFAVLNRRMREKSPRDVGRFFAPAFDRRRSYFRQRGNPEVRRTLTLKVGLA